MWVPLGSSCLGIYALPGLVCLFPLSHQGSFLSLFFQIGFQFLAHSLLLLAPTWCECWYAWSCHRSSLHYPHFLVSFFFLLFWLVVFCFLVFHIANLILGFIHSTVDSLEIILFLKKNLFIFRERAREGEREGEKHWCERESLIGCLSHTSNQGHGPQPKELPWLGIELLTSICGMTFNPLSHTSQGCKLFFISINVAFISDWIFLVLFSA